MEIRINNISFNYAEKTVFKDFSLELKNGDLPVVILGPSGSGKTTLLKLIAGLLKPQEGNIKYLSRNERENLNNAAPKASFIFQEPRLLPWLTILDNVKIPLEKELGKEQAELRAKEYLSYVSLNDRANAYPSELSGGQAQRVSMARAFAWPAPVILMDEPFQSLDIPLKINMMDLTLSLNEKEKRSLIIVTHDPREAVYLGGRITVLGKSAREGIVFDREISLSPEDRAIGTAAGTAAGTTAGTTAARELEKEIIRVLKLSICH